MMTGPMSLPDPDDRTAAPGADQVVEIGERAVDLVSRWLVRARAEETATERKTADQLSGVVTDPDGVAFAMRFVDRVLRPEDNTSAATQLVGLVEDGALPGFLSPVDKVLLRAGAKLAPILPGVVMPLAAKRMRGLVGHLVVDAEPQAMTSHFAARSSDGFRLNVNLLGEAVLGDAEADRRHGEAMALLDQADVDYVSVKVSAIVSQLNYWDWDGSLDRVTDRLRLLFAKASATSPKTFINLDMEEYHDLELTMSVFMRLLDEPEFHDLDAGIVLQGYLPDSFHALQELSRWAGARRAKVVDGKSGGMVKVRLVKGANLAMEQVEAAVHDWEQAPYRTKAETDANYKRCLDWVLNPERLAGLRVGVASHNLFDVAFAHLLAESRGVAGSVEFEMLEGMAESEARVVRTDSGGLLLYTPVVAEQNFDVAISYLFRRLEENASPENFIHHLFSLEPGSAAFASEAAKFRTAIVDRSKVGAEPQRTQNRLTPQTQPADAHPGFVNEADTDPALAHNRQWALAVMADDGGPVTAPLTTSIDAVDDVYATARSAQRAWADTPAVERRRILGVMADELSTRRGDLISAMIHEANKTFAQADPEVSEAIDFARYYGDRAVELDGLRSASFDPFGVVAVIPPWNFPVAIPTGGVSAALASGNAVIFKPAPETPRCAEIVAECAWAAGVPEAVLQFVRVPDDETGTHLVTEADAVILTGAFETAELFRSWKPDIRLLAETSGKNSLVITPNADIDLAVADLVASAFGHSGQKCSAASLAICVGSVYESPRLRRQLVDAVASLQVGVSTDPATNMGPTIAEPEGKLLRALTELDGDEHWLVKPRKLGPGLWSPGVRIGVAPGSWFHQTECFGPVLALIEAADLDEAIEIQNASPFGLTGGLHSLDHSEIDTWLERVEIGNAYVNRQITGAIVQRQPFGGWKRSSIGPGAKAGGPNYIAQLGTWHPTPEAAAAAADNPEQWLADAMASDREAWDAHFALDHDPTGLFCEENTFRYRPIGRLAVRVAADVDPVVVRRVSAAAEVCGVPLLISYADAESVEVFASRIADTNSGPLAVERIRVLGAVEPELRDVAGDAELHLADDPVTAEGSLELRHMLKEQAISRTLHRYGNLL